MGSISYDLLADEDERESDIRLDEITIIIFSVYTDFFAITNMEEGLFLWKVTGLDGATCMRMPSSRWLGCLSANFTIDISVLLQKLPHARKQCL